jgi:hypothetical protein
VLQSPNRQMWSPIATPLLLEFQENIWKILGEVVHIHTFSFCCRWNFTLLALQHSYRHCTLLSMRIFQGFCGDAPRDGVRYLVRCKVFILLFLLQTLAPSLSTVLVTRFLEQFPSFNPLILCHCGACRFWKNNHFWTCH